MLLIGEVLECVPRLPRGTLWRTSIRVPVNPKCNHLLFVDVPEEWPVGASVRIELELIHEPPPVGREDDIDAYKRWRAAVEDSLGRARGGKITW